MGESGATFGEIALLNRGPRTCNVQAEGYIEMEEMDAENFNRLLLEYEDMRKEFISLATARYDQTAKMVKMLETASSHVLARAKSFAKPKSQVYSQKSNKIAPANTAGSKKKFSLRKMRSSRSATDRIRAAQEVEEQLRDLSRFEEMVDIATSRSHFMRKQLNEVNIAAAARSGKKVLVRQFSKANMNKRLKKKTHKS